MQRRERERSTSLLGRRGRHYRPLPEKTKEDIVSMVTESGSRPLTASGRGRSSCSVAERYLSALRQGAGAPLGVPTAMTASLIMPSSDGKRMSSSELSASCTTLERGASCATLPRSGRSVSCNPFLRADLSVSCTSLPRRGSPRSVSCAPLQSVSASRSAWNVSCVPEGLAERSVSCTSLDSDAKTPARDVSWKERELSSGSSRARLSMSSTASTLTTASSMTAVASAKPSVLAMIPKSSMPSTSTMTSTTSAVSTVTTPRTYATTSTSSKLTFSPMIPKFPMPPNSTMTSVMSKKPYSSAVSPLPTTAASSSKVNPATSTSMSKMKSLTTTTSTAATPSPAGRQSLALDAVVRVSADKGVSMSERYRCGDGHAGPAATAADERKTLGADSPSGTPTSVSPSRMYAAPSWYKQNRELKRRSTAIMQKFIQVQPDGALLDLLADETDSAQAAKDEDELEDLRNTVKRLSGEVARLQSELNSARLQEFEAQEAAVTASSELDEARRTQAELAELRALRDNMAAAATLVQREVAALRQQCEQERQAARRMKSEADKAVKERNVMAHQSSLLAEALSQDDRLLPLLAEVENLKRLLEEERCRTRELSDDAHDEHAASSQDVELLDERLKIAEEELRHASSRAERAERESTELRERLSQLQSDLAEQRKAPPPPPPPPMAPPMPPPPPPPPLPCLSPANGGVQGGVRLRSRGCNGSSGASSVTGSSEDLVNAERNAVQDMANLLGIPRKPQVPEAIPGGAIDNIINQIKGGRFTLKATEQNLQKEKKEQPPPAVTEMLNILGTLKRRPRAAVVNSSPTTEAPRDVAL